MVFIITCSVLIVVIIVLCVALVCLLTKRKRSDNVPNTSTDEVDEERVPLRTNNENDSSIGQGTSNNDKIGKSFLYTYLYTLFVECASVHR